MARLKVLMSAYACEPNKGSEPGVGWNTAKEMAEHCDVCVLTRTNNRAAIEAELYRAPVPHLKVVYYDLPPWLRMWKEGVRGLQWYYYLWQVGASAVARKLHAAMRFDLSHHVTFGRYWSPSALWVLDVPFVWGPIGGGEAAPTSFSRSWSASEQLYEWTRWSVQRLGEQDPLVRRTAARSDVALAATRETADRLRRIGCRCVQVMPQVALTSAQLHRLSRVAPAGHDDRVRFISIGRPLHWKGFALGLTAFAAADIEHGEYWLLANGQGRRRLERLAGRLGIADRVKFISQLPRLDDVYNVLGECDVLVHPALHEAFGNVVLESMAAGRPVVCLDLGGPAVQVNDDTGYVVAAHTPDQAIRDLAKVMAALAEQPGALRRKSHLGRLRAREEFAWSERKRILLSVYEQAHRRKLR